MNINRDNYEIYLIDYIDGRLNPGQSNQLLNFLSQNPDLEEEFKNYENIKISPSKNIHLKKQVLKKDFSDIKNINNTNFDEFCIAKFEGDLQKQDEIRLNKYIEKHKEKIKDYKIYSRLFLKPDYKIIYPEKDNIKKSLLRISNRSIYYYISSAAAIFIVVILLLMNNKKGKENISPPQLAVNTPEERIVPQEEIQMVEETDWVLPKEETKDKGLSAKIINTEAKENIQGNLNDNRTIRGKVLLASLNPIDPGIKNFYEYPKLTKSGIKTAENYPADNLALRNINIQKLKNKILQDDFEYDLDDINIKEKINIWKAAEMGIKGFNYLTESDVELEKQLNSEGEIIAFALNSESFSLSTPLKK